MKTVKPGLAFLFLLMIPVQAVLDVALFALFTYLDINVLFANDAEGHGFPVITIPAKTLNPELLKPRFLR